MSQFANVQAPDLRERGGKLADGTEQATDRRLFVQLQVYTGVTEIEPLVKTLADTKLPCAIYLDLNDPRGVGVLALNENPEIFTTTLRAALQSKPFQSLTRRPEMAMIGRTYALGYEQNLEEWLIKKSVQTALNPSWPWAVWYPLRRKPEFALLSREEQSVIMKEHATLGFAFGSADYAHDIRLASHGLDERDNDFLIGLVGKELAPLSKLVEQMRRTKQTSTYIQSLGPFFVGKAAWQSAY